MGSRSQGAAGQREFRKRAGELGFIPLTVPGQRGTYHDFDDEICGDGTGLILAVEVKYVQQERFYLQSEQIEQVIETAGDFHPDTIPVVAVRWKGDPSAWYVARLRSLDRTRTGNIAIDPEHSRDHWATLDEFVETNREAFVTRGDGDDE